MAGLLETELKTYEAHKQELLGNSGGKFVLIKDGKIEGVFDSRMDAVRQGYTSFGNVPFLVKQVNPVDAPQNFTSNLLRV